jgi:hypothetical protein
MHASEHFVGEKALPQSDRLCDGNKSMSGWRTRFICTNGLTESDLLAVARIGFADLHDDYFQLIVYAPFDAAKLRQRHFKSGEAKVGLRSPIGILRTPSLLLTHDVIRAVPKAEQKNPIRMVSCWLCSKQ